MQIIQKAVIKAGEKYLILYRSEKEEIKPSCWDFPGGRLQDGEDPESGLMREVREETSLNVKVINREVNYEISLHGIMYFFVLYSVKVLENTEVILSGEHTDYRWATKKEMENLELNDFLSLYLK